jgi:preprotein translocase subunit YajC
MPPQGGFQSIERMFVFNSILLQDPTSGANTTITNVIFMVLLGVVFYFFIYRPQSKRQKSQADFSASLSKGDNVVTTGGLFGKIVALDKETVTLEVDRALKLKFLRTSISVEYTQSAFPNKSAGNLKNVKETEGAEA